MKDHENLNRLSNELKSAYFKWRNALDANIEKEKAHDYALICIARLYAIVLACDPELIEEAFERAMRNFPTLVDESLYDIAEAAKKEFLVSAKKESRYARYPDRST